MTFAPYDRQADYGETAMQTANTPVQLPASATTVVRIPLREHTRTVMLLFGNSVNITALSVTGDATGALYATITGTPASGVLMLPVAGAIETSISLSATLGAAGSCLLLALEDCEAYSPPAFIGPNPAQVTTLAVTGPIGAQGNLANALVLGIGGVTAVFVMAGVHFVAVFGHVSAATTVTLQISADGVNWFAEESVTLAAAADFGFTTHTLPAGSQLRVLTSAAATITATALASN